MKYPALLPVALLILGGGLGYVRKLPSPHPGSLPQTGETKPETPAHGKPGGADSGLPGLPPGAVFQEARDFLSRLEAARREDFPALWDELITRTKADQEAAGSPDGAGTDRDRVRRILVMERWAELDPRGAWEFSKTVKEGCFPLIASVFKVWGADDPEAALAALKEEKQKDSSLQAVAAAGWLQSVKDEPAALIARAARLTWMDVSQLEAGDFRAAVSDSLLEKLYAADPVGLSALKSSLPGWFGEMLEMLEWKKSLRENPDAALAALESMPLTPEKMEGSFATLRSLAETQPEKVADLLLKLGSRPGDSVLTGNAWNNEGGQLLRTLITLLGPRDPERVRQLVSQGSAAMVSYELVTDALLLTDPRAALAIAPGLAGTEQLAEMISPPLPPMDAETALAAVRGAPPSHMRDKLMERALLEMQGRNPEEAQAWVDSLPEGEVRNSARLTLDLTSAPPNMRQLERIGEQLGKTDGPLDKAAELRLRYGIGTALMDDWTEATRRITGWPPGPARDAALTLAANRAAAYDNPSAAQAWAASLPEESQRRAAYAGIAKGWTATDPVAASEWVAALPEGAPRESAVGSFASTMAERDPEAGLQWAATLKDPADRLRHLQEIAGRWKAKDTDAATAAVQSLPGLSETDKAALLKPRP